MSYKGQSPAKDYIRKILVLKIKGSSIYYNYPIEVFVFESTNSSGMAWLIWFIIPIKIASAWQLVSVLAGVQRRMLVAWFYFGQMYASYLGRYEGVFVQIWSCDFDVFRRDVLLALVMHYLVSMIVLNIWWFVLFFSHSCFDFSVISLPSLPYYFAILLEDGLVGDDSLYSIFLFELSCGRASLRRIHLFIWFGWMLEEHGVFLLSFSPFAWVNTFEGS